MTVEATELKRNFPDILKEAGGSPVAVIVRNRSEAYFLVAAGHACWLTYMEESGRTAMGRSFPLSTL